MNPVRAFVLPITLDYNVTIKDKASAGPQGADEARPRRLLRGSKRLGSGQHSTQYSPSAAKRPAPGRAAKRPAPGRAASVQADGSEWSAMEHASERLWGSCRHSTLSRSWQRAICGQLEEPIASPFTGYNGRSETPQILIGRK